MIYIFDEIEKVNETSLEADLSLIPAWRRTKALAYGFHIDRVLCVKSYLLLAQGLLSEYGITDIPEFSYGPKGKPFLKDYPNIHFSLSHCHKAAICSIDNVSTGCDIEQTDLVPDEALMRMCLNDGEIRSVKGSSHPGAEFAKIWTRKEAFLKMTGTGLRSDLPDVLLSTLASEASFETFAPDGKGYVYSICRYPEKANNNPSRPAFPSSTYTLR